MKTCKYLSFFLFNLSFTSGPDLSNVMAAGLAALTTVQFLGPPGTGPFATANKNTLDPKTKKYAYDIDPINRFAKEFQNEEQPYLARQPGWFDLKFSILGVKYRVNFEPRVLEQVIEFKGVDEFESKILIELKKIPILLALPIDFFSIHISEPEIKIEPDFSIMVSFYEFKPKTNFDAIILFQELAAFKGKMLQLLIKDFPTEAHITKEKKAEYLSLFKKTVTQATCNQIMVR